MAGTNHRSTADVYREQLTHGEVAFLEWSVSTDRAWIDDGADSFWNRDGKIQVMTIHYTVHTRFEGAHQALCSGT